MLHTALCTLAGTACGFGGIHGALLCFLRSAWPGHSKWRVKMNQVPSVKRKRIKCMGKGAFPTLENRLSGLRLEERQIITRPVPPPSPPNHRNFQAWTLLEITLLSLEVTKGQFFRVTKAIDSWDWGWGLRSASESRRDEIALNRHPPTMLSIMQNICFLPGCHWRFACIILPFILERQAVRNCSLLRVCECVHVYTVK